MQRPVDYDVLIVGAGPVGLLLATALGAQGVRTLIVEKRTAPPEHSMAIGITPPSLRILNHFGLDEEFIRRGVRIDTAKVHEDGEYLGQVSFAHLPSEYRFILSLPQSTTIRILQENLPRFASVDLRCGMEFASLEERSNEVLVDLRENGGSESVEVRARYLVGCDGHRSVVREALGIHFDAKVYRPRFVMADFDDDTKLGVEAHLFFGSEAAIESFPLPGGRRRWIVMARQSEDIDNERYIPDMVARLTGHSLHHSRRSFLSAFQPRRLLAHRFYQERAILCGDAAHVMSPIGGQGMNTGFAGAALLGEMLPRLVAGKALAKKEFAFYDRVRRKAFRVAAARAARGMWLGTRTGWAGSKFRKVFIRNFLFRKPMKKKLPDYFAMLTIPFSDPGLLQPGPVWTARQRS